jgi:hypothetical protein
MSVMFPEDQSAVAVVSTAVDGPGPPAVASIPTAVKVSSATGVSFFL